MTYGITGAGGQLGTSALRHLLTRVPASQVVAITRTPDKPQEFAGRGEQLRAGDFKDPAGLTQALASVDRLLIATDGSADGERATAFVASCGLFDTSRIRGVSVIDPTLPWWAAMAPTDATIAGDTYAGASDAARGRAAVAVDTAGWLLGTPSTTIARTGVDGDVASAILAEARAWEADVVAVGTRGNSGVKRLLLGSVSRNVLHHAPMSVLIVRPTVASRSTSQREEPVAAAV